LLIGKTRYETMDAVADLNLVTPCGSYCGECQNYQKNCAGCGYAKGKPFWGECRFYPCAKQKNVEHCGLCLDFPCEYFMSTYDPSEGAWRVFYRAGQLAYRRKVGTKTWLKEKMQGKIADPKHQKQK
jgi:hypothetical protein